MTVGEIEELKNQDGSFNDQVQAIFQGTTALEKFARESVRPRIHALITPTELEMALKGIFYRSLAWSQSLVVLNKNIHFQAVCAAARSIFELLVDVKELTSNPSTARKYHDYTFIERFRVASNTVTYFDSIGDLTSGSIERAFISDPQRIARFDAVRQAHWGLNGLGKPKSPKNNWQNQDLRARTDALGGSIQLRYRDAYSRASWFIHGGLTSVSNVSPVGIQAAFGWGHTHFQECFAEMIEDICTACQLFAADQQLRESLRQAKQIPGKSLIQALLLEKQRKEGGEV